MKNDKLTDFAAKAGISISYASQLLSKDLSKRRVPTVEMALMIYKKTGVKLGLLSAATDTEARSVIRMAERAVATEAA